MKGIHKLFAGLTVSLLMTAQLAARLIPAFAAEAPPLPPQNSAERHIDCSDTGLSDQAKDYYSGVYSYEKLAALSGAKDTSTSLAAMKDNELFDSLHKLMSDTQTFFPEYAGYKAGSLAYYWNRTDAEKDSVDFIGFYSDIHYDYSAENKTKNFNMEREHIWPKSNASFFKRFGGADLHHLRPSVSEINMAKSNYAFANIRGLYPEGTSDAAFEDTVYAWKNLEEALFECKDDVKGDVARILLYVYCRWEQPNLYSDIAPQKLPPLDPDDDQNYGLRAIQDLDTLLEWMEDDPVDTWEMERNDLVQQVQGNRNVFIDYPELAFRMFGREIPKNILTPSHEGCHHEYTLTESVPSDCANEGRLVYECSKCGEKRSHAVYKKSHVNTDGDRFCDICGTTLSHRELFTKAETITPDDHILLICKSDGCSPCKPNSAGKIYSKKIAAGKNGVYPELDNGIISIEETEGGYYLITDGYYLTPSESCTYLSCDKSPNSNSVWRIETTDDGYLTFTSANITFTDKNGNKEPCMLESYNGALTVYHQNQLSNHFKFKAYTSKEHCTCINVPEKGTGEGNTVACRCEFCGKEFMMTVSAIRGDLDHSGQYDIGDIILMQKKAAGWKVGISDLDADLDGDNKFTIDDLLLLQKVVAGWKVTIGKSA